MSKVYGIIEDGYTERAVVNGVQNLYPRVAFSYRPMLQSERLDYYRAADGMTPAKAANLAADYLASHLREWDLTNRKGEVVPITADNLARLKDKLFMRLWGVVMTNDAPDEAPDSGPDDALAFAKDAKLAAETGKTVAQVREEREAKNSSRA